MSDTHSCLAHCCVNDIIVSRIPHTFVSLQATFRRSLLGCNRSGYPTESWPEEGKFVASSQLAEVRHFQPQPFSFSLQILSLELCLDT